MKRLLTAALAAACALALLALAPSAQAFKVISTAGEGAGQTSKPAGLAINEDASGPAAGRLYVADAGNNRVNVFGPDGAFVKAFGWGVKTGQAKFEQCVATCLKGLSGEGSGQFANATAIAVNNSGPDEADGDVYVVNWKNNRVEKFDWEGNFLLTFGGGVNKTKVAEAAPKAERDVCPLDPGDVCGKGADEFVEGAFSTGIVAEILVAVGPGGVVYVADSQPAGTEKFRLQRFEADGALISPQQLLQPEGQRARALAVDSSGEFYVGTEGSGQELYFKYQVGSATPLEERHERYDVLASDAADRLFGGRIRTEGSAGRHSIAEIGPGGAVLRRFGYGVLEGNVGGIAPYASAGGDIYASEREGLSRVVQIDFPDPGPIVYPEPCGATSVGNTKASLNADVNPEGKPTTVHFDYVDQASFQSEGGWSSPAVRHTPESESIGSDLLMHVATAQTGVLVPETEYRCRVVAANEDDPEVIGEEGTFTTLEPLEIGATWASEVGTEAATLSATVNPLGIPTTAYFELVDEAGFQQSGFEGATKLPVGEAIDLGAGEAFKVASVQVPGLAPGTAYRYRIVATDVLIAPKEIVGPTKRLRTYPAVAEQGLPDSRAWELVSPAQKGGAEVAIPASAGGIPIEGYTRIQAGAGSGEAITYTSWTAFADPETAPGVSQYLSRRGAEGWATQNITPASFGAEPLAQANALFPPYRGFSADLATAGLVMGKAAIAGERGSNLYLRDNAAGTLSEATPEAPVLAANYGPFFCLDYAGAGADGKRVFFAANASYAGAPAAKESSYNLYEWSAADGLRLASVLPSGNPAAPTAGTAFGATGLHCSEAEKVTRNVVSADGSKAFWTYAPPSGATQLLARLDGAQTVQLDKRISGLGSSGNGVFLAAGTDGSKVFFTSPNQLLTGAGPGDLYRYDFDADPPLTDLTPGGADVKGMVGASDDGSRAYFVATAVLSGEETNEAGQSAQAGANNLYLYEDGESGAGEIVFVATLGGEDGGVWESRPKNLRARLSPDGRHLAFLSSAAEQLVGYDNTIAAGEHCQRPDNAGIGHPLSGGPLCPQAFLYDADAASLRCASCNPSGARPAGPSELPGWTNPLEGPRYLADDGSRLFFESLDSLTPKDENGLRDVYEFELEGSGGCEESSPGFDQAAGGCHFLLSTGTDSDESYLLDASSSGRDVFFATRDRLVGWDTNANFDVYDARAGGGFPEPAPEPTLCEGEACKPPPGPGPAPLPSPGSASHQGAGNPPQATRRCPKAKVRRKGRCVRRHQARHRRAKADRRASR